MHTSKESRKHAQEETRNVISVTFSHQTYTNNLVINEITF